MSVRRWFWRVAHVVGLSCLFTPTPSYDRSISVLDRIASPPDLVLLVVVFFNVALLVVAWTGIRCTEIRRSLRGFLFAVCALLTSIAYVLSKDMNLPPYEWYWIVVTVDALLVSVFSWNAHTRDTPDRRTAFARSFFWTLAALAFAVPMLVMYTVLGAVKDGAKNRGERCPSFLVIRLSLVGSSSHFFGRKASGEPWPSPYLSS